MKNYLVVLAAVLLQGCGCTVVNPGNRGIKVYMGAVDQTLYGEGLQWHAPFLTTIYNISVQQQRGEMPKTECYSSDLQQIDAHLTVLYGIPEGKAIEIFQKYNGAPFNMLVIPRVNEALKEVTALRTAANIVQEREKVKQAALASARTKIGDMVTIYDIVIEDLSLSKQLEKAIEDKMVQQQKAAQAEFIKQQTKVEAETAIIQAEGEAKSINIKGAAIKDNPKIIDLQIAQKWNGVAPLVVGGNNANILLPVGHEAR